VGLHGQSTLRQNWRTWLCKFKALVFCAVGYALQQLLYQLVQQICLFFYHVLGNSWWIFCITSRLKHSNAYYMKRWCFIYWVSVSIMLIVGCSLLKMFKSLYEEQPSNCWQHCHVRYRWVNKTLYARSVCIFSVNAWVFVQHKSLVWHKVVGVTRPVQCWCLSSAFKGDCSVWILHTMKACFQFCSD